jgi:hypothetical protein
MVPVTRGQTQLMKFGLQQIWMQHEILNFAPVWEVQFNWFAGVFILVEAVPEDGGQPGQATLGSSAGELK